MKQGQQGVKGGLVKTDVYGEATPEGQKVFVTVQHGISHCGQLDLVLSTYPILQGIEKPLLSVAANVAHYAMRVMLQRRMHDLTARAGQKQRQATSRW
jgi:hypothetical protein